MTHLGYIEVILLIVRARKVLKKWLLKVDQCSLDPNYLISSSLKIINFANISCPQRINDLVPLFPKTSGRGSSIEIRCVTHHCRLAIDSRPSWFTVAVVSSQSFIQKRVEQTGFTSSLMYMQFTHFSDPKISKKVKNYSCFMQSKNAIHAS